MIKLRVIAIPDYECSLVQIVEAPETAASFVALSGVEIRCRGTYGGSGPGFVVPACGATAGRLCLGSLIARHRPFFVRNTHIAKIKLAVREYNEAQTQRATPTTGPCWETVE